MITPSIPARVFVAGLSAGGAMAAIMAVAYPDLYAAVGVHSGLAYGAAQDVGTAMMAMIAGGSGAQGTTMPLIIFHGDSDSIVAVANAEHLLTANLSDGRHAGEEAGPRTTSIRIDVRRRARAHHDGARRPGRPGLVEAWIVHGGGHAWFGGTAGGRLYRPAGPGCLRGNGRFFLGHRQCAHDPRRSRRTPGTGTSRPRPTGCPAAGHHPHCVGLRSTTSSR